MLMTIVMADNIKSTQKQPSCIKRVWPSKSLGEKSCEIKSEGGSHEMVTMMLIILIMAALLEFIIINIIAAISWPPPLILQLFRPGFLKAGLTFVLLCFADSGRC